jgi:hypothetical protein
MPRLNNDHYIQRHLLLRQMWLKQEGRFSLLTPTQQWDVHDYYLPSHEFTEAELLVHRRQITLEHPTVPARASKAFKILIDPARSTRTAETVRTAPNGRQIRVRAVVQPEPNFEQLARALLSLAEQLARDEERKR